MKPLHVRFAEGWDLPESISGIAPFLIVYEQEKIKLHLLKRKVGGI